MDHLLGNTIAFSGMMLSLYFVILIVITLVLTFHWPRGRFARRLSDWADKEIDGLERIAMYFVNCYWLVRCLCLKRWWQNRSYYARKTDFGMSWEGKEKEYMNRYASSKT